MLILTKSYCKTLTQSFLFSKFLCGISIELILVDFRLLVNFHLLRIVDCLQFTFIFSSLISFINSIKNNSYPRHFFVFYKFITEIIMTCFLNCVKCSLKINILIQPHINWFSFCLFVLKNGNCKIRNLGR